MHGFVGTFVQWVQTRGLPERCGLAVPGISASSLRCEPRSYRSARSTPRIRSICCANWNESSTYLLLGRIWTERPQIFGFAPHSHPDVQRPHFTISWKRCLCRQRQVGRLARQILRRVLVRCGRQVTCWQDVTVPRPADYWGINFRGRLELFGRRTSR